MIRMCARMDISIPKGPLTRWSRSQLQLRTIALHYQQQIDSKKSFMFIIYWQTNKSSHYMIVVLIVVVVL